MIAEKYGGDMRLSNSLQNLLDPAEEGAKRVKEQ